MIIAILTVRPDFWQQHLPLMERRGFEVRLADSPARTGQLLKEAEIGLVLVDLPHNFDSVSQSVKEILKYDDGVSIALVTNLKEKDYAEATGGLGVLLGLPQHPKENDVLLLLDNIEMRVMRQNNHDTVG